MARLSPSFLLTLACLLGGGGFLIRVDGGGGDSSDDCFGEIQASIWLVVLQSLWSVMKGRNHGFFLGLAVAVVVAGIGLPSPGGGGSLLGGNVGVQPILVDKSLGQGSWFDKVEDLSVGIGDGGSGAWVVLLARVRQNLGREVKRVSGHASPAVVVAVLGHKLSWAWAWVEFGLVDLGPGLHPGHA